MAGQCSCHAGCRKLQEGKGRAMDERYMQTDAEISENLCQDVAGGISSGDNVPEWNYRICGGYSESHGRLLGQ